MPALLVLLILRNENLQGFYDLYWHNIPSKFYQNLLIGSNVMKKYRLNNTIGIFCFYQGLESVLYVNKKILMMQST
jgi:hypothetical protein